MDTAHSAALKQKIRPAGAGAADQGGPRRAFRLALARAAEAYSGLGLQVTDYADDWLDIDQVLERLGEAPVIYVLSGPKETLGLVGMSAGLQASLLEHLTTGRIGPGEGEVRRPTRIDTALTGDFLDKTLRMLADETGAFSGFPDFSAFSYSHALPDKRAAEMAVEAMPFRLFRIGLDIEDGRRSAQMSIFIPLIRPGRGAGLSIGGWDKVWSEQVRRVEVQIEGILCRLRRTLTEVIALEPGQVIEIPRSRLDNVAVIGGDGGIIARAKLGRTGMNRALRINAADGPSADPMPEPAEDAFVPPAVQPVAASPLPGAGAASTDIGVIGAGPAATGGSPAGAQPIKLAPRTLPNSDGA